MMNNPFAKESPLLIGTLIGVGAECLFLAFSFVTAFGICADSTIAERLFPYALATDPSLDKHLGFAFIIALIQWPIYGVVIGLAWIRNRSSKRHLVMFSVVGLLAVHIIACVIASNRVENMWDARFSHYSVEAPR